METTNCEHCGEDVVYDADDSCCPTYCADCQRAEDLHELHLDDLADKEISDNYLTWAGHLLD